MIKEVLDKLDAILKLMVEEREERKAAKETADAEARDKELITKAKEVKELARKMPTGGIHSSIGQDDLPIRSGGELIPINLSERDKDILREFYGS